MESSVMLKLASLLSAGMILGGMVLSEPAEAVTVDYALTFTGTDGTKGNGTGLLVINETSPLASFSENSYGDLVSLVATIGGLTFNFVPASVDVDLGTSQTFYSLTGSSSPGVLGPKGLVETLVLGGFGFNMTNPGGPNLEDGKFSIGTGVVSATPLPPAWTMMLIGLAVLGFAAYQTRKSARFALAA
jgi:hypothetical protein